MIYKLKEDAWSRYRKKPNTKRYKIYKGLRNGATRSVRKAKYMYELELSKEVKSNPRAFGIGGTGPCSYRGRIFCQV